MPMPNEQKVETRLPSAPILASPYAIIKQALRVEKQSKLPLAAETLLIHSKL